ncbi:hypothetical protein LJY25_06825 [Hymenobacter sp. BT175]|uniref:hypothetical protein n=1 Tax=Hymenobacter translucens TaxID=2886507 RepID=UPI001D0DDA22|nr:hypothetical protein [Hymenobacter translucens]MCC2546152.1 hypothetical protein [Hymenobacter translucens]
MRIIFLITLAFLLAFTGAGPALAQKVKSVPFSYLPEQSEDHYNKRVQNKTLSLPGGGFIILAHKAGTEYAVERYDSELKRLWATAIPLSADQRIDGFARSARQATVLIFEKNEASQSLTAQPIDLQSGQKKPAKKLLDVTARGRRPGAAFSPDGTKLAVWQYVLRGEQIRAINASVYDESLAKLKDRTYDFHDQGAFFSTTVHIGNDGTQFVTLVSDEMKKLTLRRYRNDNPDIRVMSVAVGGTFGGKVVTVLDTRFRLEPDNTLYAALLCTERETGEYYSLKVVRFDTNGEGDMKFAPEFRFTPEYLAEVNKVGQTSSKRLEDVYLSDLLLTPEKQLVVVAEKEFEEGGDNSPAHARELHLFGYNEFQTPTWHTIIPKNQVASAAEGFTGLGYRASALGSDLQFVTQEKLEGKSDLYLRRVNAATGVVSAPQKLRLTVAADQGLSYVKDFTAWLDSKTIVAVSRPSKKSAALMLNKIVLK